MEERTDAPGRDWPWLLTLFVLVLSLRLWQFTHTEVTARDGVFFIRIALEMETKNYVQVVRGQHQHPGYSYLIWQVSKPMRWIMGRFDPMVMQYSAQLVTLLAALGLIFPAYYFGKLGGKRWLGAGAILYFQLLPTPGHYLSDGVSDGVFLFFVASALCFTLYGFERGRWYDFPMAGICCGLAYWTRPEGVIVLLTALVCLCGFQLYAPWRRPWRQWGRELAGLVGFALLAGSTYFIAAETFSLKPSGNLTLQEHFNITQPSEMKQHEPTSALDSHLWAMTFQPGWYKASMALAYELGRGFYIIGVVPAILGAFGWPWLRSKRMGLLIVTYYCGQTAALMLLGKAVGYISERHVMILVYLGCFSAMIGMEMTARWLLSLWAGRAAVTERALAVCSLGLLGVFIAAGLPRTLQPLHASRAGNYHAGLWLGKQLQPGDEVADLYHWASFYAGFDFMPSDAPPTGVRYVVASRAKEIPSEAAGHSPVFVWPKNATTEHAKVTIWKLPFPAAPPPAAVVPAQPVNRPKAIEPAEKGRT